MEIHVLVHKGCDGLPRLQLFTYYTLHCREVSLTLFWLLSTQKVTGGLQRNTPHLVASSLSPSRRIPGPRRTLAPSVTSPSKSPGITTVSTLVVSIAPSAIIFVVFNLTLSLAFGRDSPQEWRRITSVVETSIDFNNSVQKSRRVGCFTIGVSFRFVRARELSGVAIFCYHGDKLGATKDRSPAKNAWTTPEEKAATSSRGRLSSLPVCRRHSECGLSGYMEVLALLGRMLIQLVTSKAWSVPWTEQWKFCAANASQWLEVRTPPLLSRQQSRLFSAWKTTWTSTAAVGLCWIQKARLKWMQL